MDDSARPQNTSYFRKSSANPQTPAHSIVGADDSVRPQNTSYFRKSSANPQTPTHSIVGADDSVRPQKAALFLKSAANPQYLSGRQSRRPLQSAVQICTCPSGGAEPRPYQRFCKADSIVCRRAFARRLCAFLPKRQMIFSRAQIFCRKSGFPRKDG